MIDHPTRKELFPRSLDKYLDYPKEDRLYFSTIIGYQDLPPRNVTVVWLDKDTWYVDEVFYRMEVDDLLKEITPIEEKQLVRGTIDNFMKHSFVIQPKLSEGLNYLQVNTAKKQFRKDEVVLEIALTPGGPGSSSYFFTFYADGKISVPGLNYSTPSYFISHIQWVDIQNKVREIDFKYLSDNMAPAQFVHDGQSRIVGAIQNEYFYRLVFGHGNPMPERVSEFSEYIIKVISELDSKVKK